MKTFLLALLALTIAMAALAATDVRSGVWTADVYDGRLHMTVLAGHERKSHFGNVMNFAIPLSRFEGLTQTDTARFTLRAAAGTFAFNGHFSGDEGAGHFDFTPNEAFNREMGQLGYSDFDEGELFVLASHDFSPDTIRQLRTMGYDPSRRQIDDVAIFGITPAVVREYERLGFEHLTLRDLTNLRVGGVDASYVNRMRELGYQSASAREVADMAILGVTPDYVRELQAAGLKNLSTRELRDLRVGNITAKSIAAFSKVGYGSLSPRQLSEFGIQHVTPEYIVELRKMGYDNLSPRQLTEMRIFNVTPEYIQQMTALGIKDLRKMIDLKTTGAAEILLKKK